MCSRESCMLHFVAASTNGAKKMNNTIINSRGGGILHPSGTKRSLFQAFSNAVCCIVAFLAPPLRFLAERASLVDQFRKFNNAHA